MKEVKVKVVVSKDQLKEHQIYLNNLVSDEVFIMCGDPLRHQKYYMMTETDPKRVK